MCQQLGEGGNSACFREKKKIFWYIEIIEGTCIIWYIEIIEGTASLADSLLLKRALASFNWIMFFFLV